MKIKIKKIRTDAITPKYALPGDAGLDLFSTGDITVGPSSRVKIPTGISMEIPDGYVGLIWDKSGLSFKTGLKTLGGVIDSSYRGEIHVTLFNPDPTWAIRIEKDSKVAQLLIQKVERVELEEVDELSTTERGEGGFGSTGN